MKKLFKKIKKKQLIMLSISLLIIVSLATIIPNVLAEANPIKKINLSSTKTNYENKESGAWTVDKSAEWTSSKTAKITFNLKSIKKINEKKKDVILVIDNSDSMEGAKLNKIKSNATELINNIIDDGGKVALIGFHTKATLLSDFSDEKIVLEGKVFDLEATGSTNYYNALKSSEELLANYTKKDNRELVMVFLTDGEPNINTPNEVAEYEFLKSKYDYLTINAIQYDMGKDISESIKNISDNQYIVSNDISENILLEATKNPEKYDEFKIIDYINDEYFDIDNANASIGKVYIDNNKITWDMDDLYISGNNEKVTINVRLKSGYLDTNELLKTNKKEEIISKLKDKTEDVISSNSPILSLKYDVEYKANTPESCTINNIPTTSKHNVFETVEISDFKPECSGYQFKGWKTPEGTKKINEDYFIMPEYDITLVAEWSKLNIKKSMDGEVYTAPKSIINALPSISYNEELWSHRSKITKIVFQDEINEMPNASYTYDISEGNNKSVMAHLVSNGNDTYTAYIQGNGKVYANENSSNLFYGFTILESIENIELLDTSKATNMSYMFAFCKELQNLDLSSFDTSNVTNMSVMFAKSLNMKKLDLTSFNTSKVTDMSYMFVGDNTAVLEEIDLSSFNTSNVTTMFQMFGRAMALKRLDLSNFNTSKVTTMYYMFYQCTNLEELNLKNFDMSAATTIDSLCRECSKLRTVTIDNFRTDKNTNTASIFYKCSELTGPPLIPSGAETIGKYAYGECRKLTGNIVLPEGIKTVKEGAFQHCVSVTGVLTLPSTLERIESFAFNHCESMQNTSLTIPKSVKFIGDTETYGTHVFYNFATNKITEYIVEAGNTKFKAEDGVLLSKDGTRLVAYPAMKPGDTYEMPEGITNLDELAFSRARNLKKLILPNSLTLTTTLPSTYLNIANNLSVALYVYTTINEIGVRDTNTKYKTIDGVLYSKDGTTLWYVPSAKVGNINIESGVVTAEEGSFYTLSKSQNIFIPNTVTSIGSNSTEALELMGPTHVTFEEGSVYHFNESGKIVKN